LADGWTSEPDMVCAKPCGPPTSQTQRQFTTRLHRVESCAIVKAN